MEPIKKHEIVQKFLSGTPCPEIPELKDCKELRSQYDKELSGPGCTPCKRRALAKKYTHLITNRI
jgi:hypothetical protein